MFKVNCICPQLKQQGKAYNKDFSSIYVETFIGKGSGRRYILQVEGIARKALRKEISVY